MPQRDLYQRTKRFALDVIAFAGRLPNAPPGWVMGKQLLRSGTSIGSNYRESQRSRPEFNSKIQICQQEIEETIYWLELIEESGLLASKLVEPLSIEIQELRAIFIAISKSSARPPASP